MREVSEESSISAYRKNLNKSENKIRLKKKQKQVQNLTPNYKSIENYLQNRKSSITDWKSKEDEAINNIQKTMT